MNIAFTNKETYLAYRADWKAQYKTLSAEIRSTKQEFKKAQRESGYDYRLHQLLVRSKSKAREMLAELQDAKQEAQRLAAQKA